MAPSGQDNQKSLGRNQQNDVNKHTKTHIHTRETAADMRVLVCAPGAVPAADRVVVKGGSGPWSFPRGFHAARQQWVELHSLSAIYPSG